MAQKVYVVSRLDYDISEKKPGLGEFHIPANSKTLIEDYTAVDRVGGKSGPEVTYVKHSALEIARAIVQDFKLPGLSVVVEKEEEKKENKEKEKPITKEESKELAGAIDFTALINGQEKN